MRRHLLDSLLMLGSAVLMAASLGFVGGLWVNHGYIEGAYKEGYQEALRLPTVDRQADLKAACGYESHPISDVAWELYDRGMIPAGTAWFYTGMIMSRNKPAADCMRDELEPGWRNR